MIRNTAFPGLLLAVLLICLAAFACGDDDASDAPDDTSTPDATGSPTPTAPATLFVPDPSDPCPRPAGHAISGLVALLDVTSEALTEDGSIRQGVPVEMSLRVINCSSGELQRDYVGEQEYDFVVRAGGQSVWRWSDGQEFGKEGRTVTLGPGQELTYQATWEQVDSDGAPVPLGEYDVIGESLACDTTLRNCTTRAAETITILP